MAYQNVGTPRFYCNVIEWVIQNGIAFADQNVGSVFRTLPVNPASSNDISGITTQVTAIQGQTQGLMTENSFVAILGHDFYLTGVPLSQEENFFTIEDTAGFGVSNMTNVINTEIYATADCYPVYAGFNIATFSGQNDLQFRLGNIGSKIGSVIIGTYYDMPHSPELNLTMTREMDGVSRIRTKGGNDLISRGYTSSPLWGGAAPWEIYSGTPANQALSRVGRRTWDLSFNYLDDGDVFGSNLQFGNYIWEGSYYQGVFPSDHDQYEGYTGGSSYAGDLGWDEGSPNSWNYNILTDDNFYSQVIHRTNGGQLPFIFQPDSNNNSADNFAIAKLDMKSFKCNQVSNGIYSINLKIREVW